MQDDSEGNITTIEDAQGFVPQGAEDAGDENVGSPMSVDEVNLTSAIGFAAEHVELDELVRASPSVYYLSSEIWRKGSSACRVAGVVARAFDLHPRVAQQGPLQDEAAPRNRTELERSVKRAAKAVWDRPSSSSSPPVRHALVVFRVQHSAADGYSTFVDDAGEAEWFAVHPEDQPGVPKLRTKKGVIEALADPTTARIGFMPVFDENTRIASYDLFLADDGSRKFINAALKFCWWELLLIKFPSCLLSQLICRC